MSEKELWEEFYQDKEFAFDFANRLMIKDEFNTNSSFAWNKEKYDTEDNKYFIANTKTIKERDGRSIFEINDKRYIIAKNPNYNYSIITASEFMDYNCPINFDLVLNNEINNYSKKKYLFLIISFKKMNPDTNNLFCNYIIKYIKSFNNIISFDINDMSETKTDIKFQLLVDEENNEGKNFEIVLTIFSLIPLIIYRLKNLKIELWKDGLTSYEFFNIFITTKEVFENAFELKNIDILGMLFSFENAIFIDEKTKNNIVKNGSINNNNFIIAKNSGTKGIFEYKFSRIDIADYYSNLINKKN